MHKSRHPRNYLSCRGDFSLGFPKLQSIFLLLFQTFADWLLTRSAPYDSPIRANFCAILVAQKHNRRSQSRGSPPDLQLDALESALFRLAKACRTVRECKCIGYFLLIFLNPRVFEVRVYIGAEHRWTYPIFQVDLPRREVVHSWTFATSDLLPPWVKDG